MTLISTKKKEVYNIMNKLMGFYELKESSLPTIPWKVYTPDVILDENILWTIRSAIHKGNDLNLPRVVGKEAKEAKEFADDLYKKIGERGIVIFYPYFIANKSGTLNVFYDKVVIEAVNKDLWNLVTNQDLDVSLIYDMDMNLQLCIGNEKFLSDEECNQLLSYSKKVKNIFRDDILEGHSILLEWSYACDCDKNGHSVGNSYLVFYEARTV